MLDEEEYSLQVLTRISLMVHNANANARKVYNRAFKYQLNGINIKLDIY